MYYMTIYILSYILSYINMQYKYCCIIYIHIYVYTYYIYIYTYIYIYIYIYIYTYIYTHTHIYIHAIYYVHCHNIYDNTCIYTLSYIHVHAILMLLYYIYYMPMNFTIYLIDKTHTDLQWVQGKVTPYRQEFLKIKGHVQCSGQDFIRSVDSTIQEHGAEHSFKRISQGVIKLLRVAQIWSMRE